jgi:putative DNA primase/helicase
MMAGIHGEQARPFEARLEVVDGRVQWSMKEIEDVERTRVAALLATGLSIREIAEETGLHRFKVHRLKQRIEQEATEGPIGQAVPLPPPRGLGSPLGPIERA